jgi:hypothetical protein
MDLSCAIGNNLIISGIASSFYTRFWFSDLQQVSDYSYQYNTLFSSGLCYHCTSPQIWPCRVMSQLASAQCQLLPPTNNFLFTNEESISNHWFSFWIDHLILEHFDNYLQLNLLSGGWYITKYTWCQAPVESSKLLHLGLQGHPYI